MRFGIASCFPLALALSAPVMAQTPAAEDLERAGLGDSNTPQATAPSLPAREQALDLLGGAGSLLLIPESTNDRVMAFDPLTGDLIDADFIPSDATNLSTPIEAILSADGTQVLVSDQINDVVQAYDLMTGAFVATFAPAGGVDTAILDNVRGVALRPNGNLLVSVGGGTNADAIAEFDTAGVSLGNFVGNGVGGVGSPFDVFLVEQPGGVLAAGDFLVPGINSDAVHRYDATGAAQANFVALDTFGEQVAQAANGNVLVANFSGTQEGIVEFTNAGALVGVYDPPALGGYRGVFELPNGNLLVTNGNGVHEMDRASTVIRTVVSGVSARFITLASLGGDADLELVKTGPAVPVVQGGNADFVLQVNNLGPSDASNVVVTDTLPAGLTHQSNNCGATAAGQVVTWTIGALANGASASCTVTVSVDAVGMLVNSAAISSDTPDPNPMNDQASATVRGAFEARPVPLLGVFGFGVLVVLVGTTGILLAVRQGAARG
ncbi:MAG: DUF11 domain-containing protein [Xanthomonadales bacterium]|nr:DUF11 domain-containing protein [Xanthomonadales bacterium]